MDSQKQIELLSPAKNAEQGIAAINCGADAVYIGAPKFGARAAAGNSLQDIVKLIHYAHKFRVKVYLTLNTILYNDEIDEAVNIIRQLYNEGIDAIIFQDMALLEADLPPVALHASTQTHNYQPERIKFLDKQNIQRIILARELSLDEIKNIRKQVNCELEYFVHGALCVCFSGQCYFSHAIGGRSANRGECAQPCRLSYDLLDSAGKVIVKDKHLLSLKDLNLSSHLYELMKAGITSFKIEGRLKDLAYVKNITAYYRQKIDSILENISEFQKSSIGKSEIHFEPDPEITFNRGFIEYFFNGRQNDISSMDSPKSKGEYIGKVSRTSNNYFEIETDKILSNGDGVFFIHGKKEAGGMLINKIEGKRIFKENNFTIQNGTEVYRNLNAKFLKTILRNDEVRNIKADVQINYNEKGLICTLISEGEIKFEYEYSFEKVISENPVKMAEVMKKQFRKAGDTIFSIETVDIQMKNIPFLTVGNINSIRRDFYQKAEKYIIDTHPIIKRIKAENNTFYFKNELDHKANAANDLAKKFYADRGVNTVGDAQEIAEITNPVIMTCKYCIKNELQICPSNRTHSQIKLKEPLYLANDYGKFVLKFNCSKCEMKILST